MLADRESEDISVISAVGYREEEATEIREVSNSSHWQGAGVDC